MSRESYATKTYKQHHTQTETKLGVFKREKAKPKIISKNETFSTTSQLKLKLKLHLNGCEIPYIISVY